MAATYEGRKPCSECGSTTKFGRGVCALRRVATHPKYAEQRKKSKLSGKDVTAKYNAKRRQTAIATGLCCTCGKDRVGKNGSPIGWKSKSCWKCIEYMHRYVEDRMKGTVQDLSTLAPVASGVTHTGRRWFRMQLPIPSWTKHTRVQVNPKGQGRFLCKAAKDMRNWLGLSLSASDLHKPWLRGEYVLNFTVYHRRSDHDQWSGGLTDDLCFSGFIGDDDLCYRSVSTRIRVPSKEDQKLVVFGRERYVKEHRCEGPSFTAERATS